MNVPHSIGFDFDEWTALAQFDPEAFEVRRKRMIETAIAQAPRHMQPRLHALQWRIDMERARASNALSACIRLSNMMWQMAYGRNGLVTAIGILTGAAPPKAAQNFRSADILAFERRKHAS